MTYICVSVGNDAGRLKLPTMTLEQQIRDCIDNYDMGLLTASEFVNQITAIGFENNLFEVTEKQD